MQLSISITSQKIMVFSYFQGQKVDTILDTFREKYVQLWTITLYIFQFKSRSKNDLKLKKTV